MRPQQSLGELHVRDGTVVHMVLKGGLLGGAPEVKLGEDLCNAAMHGDLARVQRLLEANADVNYADPGVRSPYAPRSGDTDRGGTHARRPPTLAARRPRDPHTQRGSPSVGATPLCSSARLARGRIDFGTAS